MEKNEAIVWIIGIITGAIFLMGFICLITFSTMEDNKMKHELEYKKLELIGNKFKREAV